MKIFKNLNFDKLKEGLNKTREKIVNKISETFTGKAVLDENFLDNVEEILISSDLGYEMSTKIVEKLKIDMKKESERTSEKMLETLKKSLINSLLVDETSDFEYSPELEKYKPYIILVVGVNGVGKTTTIGKLANNFKKSGLSVIVGAGDTFRAAANEQLSIWADRAGVEVVSSSKGTDPSSVAFETVSKAIKNNADVVLIDTAGRLHNKSNLMFELNKIKKVIAKLLPYAPNETFLVLDGVTGQNALVQAEEFLKASQISGLVITKLDGTAKGGMVFQIINKLKIPVRYIGVGEGIDDLQTFEPKSFVEAIFRI